MILLYIYISFSSKIIVVANHICNLKTICNYIGNYKSFYPMLQRIMILVLAKMIDLDTFNCKHMGWDTLVMLMISNIVNEFGFTSFNAMKKM
jgi:hypothetical protein